VVGFAYRGVLAPFVGSARPWLVDGIEAPLPAPKYEAFRWSCTHSRSRVTRLTTKQPGYDHCSTRHNGSTRFNPSERVLTSSAESTEASRISALPKSVTNSTRLNRMNVRIERTNIRTTAHCALLSLSLQTTRRQCRQTACLRLSHKLSGSHPLITAVVCHKWLVTCALRDTCREVQREKWSRTQSW